MACTCKDDGSMCLECWKALTDKISRAKEPKEPKGGKK